MGLGGVVAEAAAAKISAQAQMAQMMKGRPPEQQSVIRYFLADEGCLSKKMTDEAYEDLIRNKVTGTNFKQKAMDKIGLDESQVNEIPPVFFEGYLFDEKKGLAKFGKDRKWRSSIYQLSWLFFSNTQVYVYQYTFNLDEDGKKESTEEYFYKDITNFSTSSETIEKPVAEEVGGCGGKKTQLILKNIDEERFALTVPGAKFYCSMTPKDDTEGIIQAMKAKLREKKQ
jgi:hypothetical protein